MSDDNVTEFQRRLINEWPRSVYLADFGDGDGCRPRVFIQYPNDTSPLYVRGDLYDVMAARIEALQAEKDEAKTIAFQQGYKNGKAAGDAFGASLRDYVQRLEAERDAARDSVNRLGRAMGVVPGVAQCFGDVIDEAIKRLSAKAERDAAVLAEREACAALCDVVTQDHIGDIIRGIGDDIRARSKEPSQ